MSLYLSASSRAITTQNFGLLAQVMDILVHNPPLTPLNLPLVLPLASLYLSSQSRDTTTQNFGLLAQKLTELWLFQCMTPSYTPEPPSSDAHEQSVFEYLVKSYYYAKFRVSNSKIDRAMANLVHDSPLAPLNPPLVTPLTSPYLSAQSRATTMQYSGLLAERLTKLWLFQCMTPLLRP